MHSLKFRGRPPILLAKSVHAIANGTNPYAQTIIDRNTPITGEFVESVLGQSIFGWEGRNPTPALDADGNFKGTDLDLLSFLVPIVARNAVIEIPKYTNRRKTVRKENERKIGTNSFGNAIGLTSNKDVSSFSIKIFDRTIAVTDQETGKETAGAYRNYMLVDCDGHWYDGWNQIVWNPDAKENKFLSEKGLWTGNSVQFTNYVHPNRKQAIYGAPYILLKMLSERLTDEASFYRKEMQRLEDLGFSLPKGEKAPYVEDSQEGATEKVQIETMEMVLDMPAFTGAYAPVEDSEAGLVYAYRRQKELTYSLKPLVQFVIRADEVAFYRYGEKDRFVAPWMKGRTWSRGYRTPRGRVDWNIMVLSNTMALRYRIKSISQEVSAE